MDKIDKIYNIDKINKIALFPTNEITMTLMTHVTTTVFCLFYDLSTSNNVYFGFLRESD